MREKLLEKGSIFKRKWAKVLGLSLSLPSTIFAGAIIASQLVNNGVMRRSVAYGIFIFLVTGNLILIIYYGLRNKN